MKEKLEKQLEHYNLVQEILETGIDYKRLLNDPEYEKKINLVTPILPFHESKRSKRFNSLKMDQKV